jgi:hypothetical protein
MRLTSATIKKGHYEERPLSLFGRRYLFEVRLPNGLPGRPEGLPDWPGLNGLPTICPNSLMLLYAANGLGEGWRGRAKAGDHHSLGGASPQGKASISARPTRL